MIRKKILISLFCSISSIAIAADGKLQIGDNAIVDWITSSGERVRIELPSLTIKDTAQGGSSAGALEAALHETSANGRTAVLDYSVSLDNSNNGRSGSYKVIISCDENLPVLNYKTQLEFDSPLSTAITVQNHFTVKGLSAQKMLMPEKDGLLRSYHLQPRKRRTDLGAHSAAGQWELGAKAAGNHNYVELAMPLVGLDLANGPMGQKKTRLAVSFDPYCGGNIYASTAQDEASIYVSTTYDGETVPVKSEERTILLEFISGSEQGSSDSELTDGMLRSFYRTIPEIKPGADWIHDIHLVYYEYLSEKGDSWYEELQSLADKIPAEYRSGVAVCLHGWYDYFLQYGYDHENGELLDQWVAFPGSRKISMSLEKMHDMLRFSKDLGFRTLLYFADGTNSDTGAPAYRPEFALLDKDGNTTGGWVGPDSIGKPIRADPAVPDLSEWYKAYLRALVTEYGDYIDGFVWDETYYIPVNTVGYAQETPAYSDRAMMRLVSELTQIVQSHHHMNPDLVFLASDYGSVPYALTAHGTYQDSAMRPDIWGPSMFINYRNALWSCLWYPVSRFYTNENAVALGLPQALSKGWGDNTGPSEMPPEMIDTIIERFMDSVQNERKRVRYFIPTGVR